MKRYLFSILTAVFLLSAAAYGQTAKVVPLKIADHDEVKAKWDALQKAQKEWDDEQTKIQKAYLVVSENDPDKGNEVYGHSYFGSAAATKKPEYKYYRAGFEQGFEFDSTFNFLVPNHPRISYSGGGGNFGGLTTPYIYSDSGTLTIPACTSVAAGYSGACTTYIYSDSGTLTIPACDSVAAGYSGACTTGIQ